ncbi:MAG: hypothetical protein DDT34_02199 [Firmicutes bacterium]|nr:hypothetical protein [Bacillota bacterium]MBT9152296.1 hypothetical protein [Bacillota bacterium]
MRFNDVGIEAFKATLHLYERKFGIASSLFYKFTRQGIQVVDDVEVESEWLSLYEWILEGQNESRPFIGQADTSEGGNSPLLFCISC